MSQEALSREEVNSLLDGAVIISDDTGKYKVSDKNNKDKDGKFTQDKKVNNKKSNDKENTEGGIDVSNLSLEQYKNAELLLDVSVGITVELGRVNISVKDILSLGEGSIIELNKPANEPVDLLVNDRLIAKGEVVVIDESFGTRLTHIVSND